MDRFAQMIIAAARQAEGDSGHRHRRRRRSHRRVVATGIGGLKAFQDCYETLRERGPDRVNPFSIPAIIPNMGAGWVSMELGTRGPLSRSARPAPRRTWRSARAIDAIRLGRADVMFCGGTEAAITQVGIAGFDAMRALSRRNDDPSAGQPAVRRRARRVRDGRGRRGARARGARAREGARRQDLRRARRLRALLRRAPHHRAGPDRASTRRARCRWRSTTPGSTRRRSTTSTRTAPRRRSATRARRG